MICAGKTCFHNILIYLNKEDAKTKLGKKEENAIRKRGKCMKKNQCNLITDEEAKKDKSN